MFWITALLAFALGIAAGVLLGFGLFFAWVIYSL